MKSIFPAWFVASVSLLVLMFIGTTVYYHMGATSVRYNRGVSGVTFDRQFDYKLFRIDDDHAFEISSSGFVAVVKYSRGTFPFCPLCGTWERDGSVLPGPAYRKGDWLYARYTFPDSPIAWNMKTGEAVISAKKERKDEEFPEHRLEDEPFYVEKGFEFSTELEFHGGHVVDGFKELSVINESCVIYNAAFIFLFLVAFLIAIGFVIRSAIRRRKET